MDIEQAKTIAVSEILKNLYLNPIHETEHEAVYVSPLCSKRNATLHLDKITNTWFDSGVSKGGGVIELACEYLKYHKQDHTLYDILRWLERMSGRASGIKPVESAKLERVTTNLMVQAVKPLADSALWEYFAKHHITQETSRRYLTEITVLDTETGETFIAAGFKNDNDGYELRSSRFEGCLGPTDITTIRGAVYQPPAVDIFKDYIGFLTAIEKNNGEVPANDTVILNSLVNLEKAAPSFKVPYYQFAYSWIDNDAPGKTATRHLTEFFKTLGGIKHEPQNAIYAGHENFNAWFMHEKNSKKKG